MQILFGFMNPDRFIGQRVPSIFSLYEKQVLWSQPVGHNFSCIAHVVEDSTLNLRVQGLFRMSENLKQFWTFKPSHRPKEKSNEDRHWKRFLV